MSRRPASADPLRTRPPASPPSTSPPPLVVHLPRPISVSSMIQDITTNTITSDDTEIEITVLSSPSPTPPSSPTQGLSASVLEENNISSDDSKPSYDSKSRVKKSTIFDEYLHDDSDSNDIELYSGNSSPQATSTQFKPPNKPVLTPDQMDRMANNKTEALRRKKGGFRDWTIHINKPDSPTSDVSEHASLPSPPTSASQFLEDALYTELINNQPPFREAPNDLEMIDVPILSKRKRDLISNPSSIESTPRKKDIEKDKKVRLNGGLIAEGACALKTNVKDVLAASSNAFRRKLASNDETKRTVSTISGGVSKIKKRNSSNSEIYESINEMTSANNLLQFEMDNNKQQMVRQSDFNTKCLQNLASKQSMLSDIDRNSTNNKTNIENNKSTIITNGDNIGTLMNLMHDIKTNLDTNKIIQQKGDDALQAKMTSVQQQVDNTSEALSKDDGTQSHNGCSIKTQELKLSIEEKIKMIHSIQKQTENSINAANEKLQLQHEAAEKTKQQIERKIATNKARLDQTDNQLLSNVENTTKNATKIEKNKNATANALKLISRNSEVNDHNINTGTTNAVNIKSLGDIVTQNKQITDEYPAVFQTTIEKMQAEMDDNNTWVRQVIPKLQEGIAKLSNDLQDLGENGGSDIGAIQEIKDSVNNLTQTIYGTYDFAEIEHMIPVKQNMEFIQTSVRNLETSHEGIKKDIENIPLTQYQSSLEDQKQLKQQRNERIQIISRTLIADTSAFKLNSASLPSTVVIKINSTLKSDKPIPESIAPIRTSARGKMSQMLFPSRSTAKAFKSFITRNSRNKNVQIKLYFATLAEDYQMIKTQKKKLRIKFDTENSGQLLHNDYVLIKSAEGKLSNYIGQFISILSVISTDQMKKKVFCCGNIIDNKIVLSSDGETTPLDITSTMYEEHPIDSYSSIASGWISYVVKDYKKPNQNPQQNPPQQQDQTQQLQFPNPPPPILKQTQQPPPIIHTVQIHQLPPKGPVVKQPTGLQQTQNNTDPIDMDTTQPDLHDENQPSIVNQTITNTQKNLNTTPFVPPSQTIPSKEITVEVPNDKSNKPTWRKNQNNQGKKTQHDKKNMNQSLGFTKHPNYETIGHYY